jgi:hypothetical protein
VSRAPAACLAGFAPKQSARPAGTVEAASREGWAPRRGAPGGGWKGEPGAEGAGERVRGPFRHG